MSNHQRPTADDAMINAALESLQAWITRNGMAGWDPYDLPGNPIYARVHRAGSSGALPPRIWKRLEREFRLHPLALRRLLLMRPQINAKGIGLILQSQLLLKERDGNWKEMNSPLAQWLINNPSTFEIGTSWGYPFDWQSRVFIPKGTPSSVVTSICAGALLDYADATGCEEAEAAGRGAAVFLSEGLNHAKGPAKTVCLSYTPLDTFEVHNANLMAAAYLNRAAIRFDQPHWAELANACLEFTLEQQRHDGSFEYWSDQQMTGSHVDNYHTGFVLRSLHELALAGNTPAESALTAGWKFYSENLIRKPGEPPMDLMGNDTRLNIHSCAESILCPAVLSTRFPDARELAVSKAHWTIEHLQNSDGSFAHGMFGGTVHRMPYLRWSEAWMLRALAQLSVM